MGKITNLLAVVTLSTSTLLSGCLFLSTLNCVAQDIHLSQLTTTALPLDPSQAKIKEEPLQNNLHSSSLHFTESIPLVYQ